MSLSIFFLICVGFLAGIFAGMLGIGGGLILVPILYFFLQSIGVAAETAITAAVATSLATIILTGLSSAYSHHRAGYVDFEILKSWLPWVLGGGFGGAIIAAHLSGAFLKIFFSVVTIILAIHMIYTAIGSAPKFTIRQSLIKPCVTLGVVISSWIGIGGGVFNVPIMINVGISIRHAIGTSAAIGPFLALAASASFLAINPQTPIPIAHTGFIVWAAFFPIVAGSIVGAPVGASIAHRLPITALKIVFAIFLVAAALRVFLS